MVLIRLFHANALSFTRQLERQRRPRRPFHNGEKYQFSRSVCIKLSRQYSASRTIPLHNQSSGKVRLSITKIVQFDPSKFLILSFLVFLKKISLWVLFQGTVPVVMGFGISVYESYPILYFCFLSVSTFRSCYPLPVQRFSAIHFTCQLLKINFCLFTSTAELYSRITNVQ